MKLLGLVLLISFAVNSTAAGQVEVETEFGFDGYYYPDLPTPISISVRSRGAPLQGQIIIAQEVRSPWQGATEERLILPFELAGKSEKRFSLNFLVQGYIYPLSILVVAAGEVLYKEELSLKGRFLEEPLTLALGESLFPNELPTGERPIQIELRGLPSEWPGLLGVKRLYLGRMDPSGLSRAQWQALSRWVEWGGELVVLGGDNWYFQDTPTVRELIPFAPTGMGDREGRPIVLGEARGEILYRQEGSPLLISSRRGRGRLLFSTVNPLSWPVGEGFWQALSVPGKKEAPDEERTRLAGQLLSQLRLPFPSKLTLIGIYALYLGGLALFGWAALYRPSLALLIIPWLAGTMVLTARYLDRPEFAKPLVGLELDLFHDLGSTTLHSSWLGLFAKSEAELKLAVETGDGRLRQAIPKEQGDHLYDVDYLQEGGMVWASFRMRAWRERSFYLERMSADLASLKVIGGRVVVQNLSPYALGDCLLLSGERLFAFGPVAPQGAVEREVGPEASWPDEPLRAQLYSQAKEELLGRQALLCSCAAPAPFSQPAAEERRAVCLVSIEEDS